MAWKKKKSEPDESELPELPPLPEKKVAPEKEQLSDKTLIVKELPSQQVRRIKLEDGSIADLITVEESLEILLEKIDTLLERTK